MISKLRDFAKSESGAVTVDWVVLTAAIVGLGLAVFTSVRTGVNSMTGNVAYSLNNTSTTTLGSQGISH